MTQEEQYIFVPYKKPPEKTKLLINEYEQKYKECMEYNSKILEYKEIAIEYAKRLKLSHQKIQELENTIQEQSVFINKQSAIINKQNSDPKEHRIAKNPITQRNIKYIQPIKSVFTKTSKKRKTSNK